MSNRWQTCARTGSSVASTLTQATPSRAEGFGARPGMAALFRPCAPRDRLGHMRTRGLSDSSGTPAALRAAIDRTAYYPERVAHRFGGAVAGEEVVSYSVHHEPIIERGEVHPHNPTSLLTPPPLR